MGLLLSLLAGFNHAEQLADSADQQSLLFNLDPDTRRGGEDDVVSGRDGHLDAGRLPPVNAEPNRENDAVLWRRLIVTGSDEQARATESFGFKLFNDDPVEERPQLLTHALIVGQWFFAATDAYISGSRWRSRGLIRQMGL